MNNDNYVLVLVTCLAEEAEAIAHDLVFHKLATCVSIIPRMTSLYMWKNSIEKTEESQLLIKTKNNCFTKIKIRVIKFISYENPEIIVIPIIQGSNNYLKWINDVIES